MPVLVAMLQGVNVGKNKRIRMEDFRTLVGQLGGAEMTTIANSGNIVFLHDGEKSPQEWRDEIEKAVSDHVGMPIPTVVRTSEEMTDVLRANPFPSVEDPKCLHVEFLVDSIADALADLETGEDALVLNGREIYMHLPNKMSGITYDAKTLGKRLGAHRTSRNWSTVTKLEATASGLD